MIFAGFVGIREESVDPGTNDNGENLMRRMFLSHLVIPACVDPLLVDVLLTMVFQVAFGIDLLGSKRLSANAGSSHNGLSFPSWLSRSARLDIGPYFISFCLEAAPFKLQVAGGPGSSYHSSS